MSQSIPHSFCGHLLRDLWALEDSKANYNIHGVMPKPNRYYDNILRNKVTFFFSKAFSHTNLGYNIPEEVLNGLNWAQGVRP